MKQERWYKHSYRRNLVDMHIEEWDERFLSKFDPRKYVELLKKARVQSAMVYANSHVGYCYWPTNSGHMHAGIKGQDLFGELLQLIHREGMDFIAYYSLIFNNWAADQHPSWRIMDADGNHERNAATGRYVSRYGFCCPNHQEYREFVVAQIDELCHNYAFEAIFFDMTFWPRICYCPSCRKRFLEETGSELPTVIDWHDPLWIRFQRKREEWMAEFAQLATQAVKHRKPEVDVLHNGATAAYPWIFGTDIGVLNACDYLGADLYGGTLQQSFICKLFYNTTKNLPFEYYTSVSDPNLNDDHVSIKSAELLALRNYVSLAHAGAFMFIDAINPDGTMNPDVYERMDRIFAESSRFEPDLGGVLEADVAIYFSLNSKMDNNFTGSSGAAHGMDVHVPYPHLAAALGAADSMERNHIPYTVISRNNLHDLDRYRLLIVPEALVLDESETQAISRYAANGGSVYISGAEADDRLLQVAGVKRIGATKEKVTFMSPTKAGSQLLQGVSEQFPLTIPGSQPIVEVNGDVTVWAQLSLPYTDPADLSRFASIHSNPPGSGTEHPVITSRSFGNGRVVWLAAPIEAVRRQLHEKVFLSVVRELVSQPFAFEAEAPPAVQLLLYRQEERSRLVLHALNQQELLPAVPVSGVKVKVRVGERKVARVTVAPEHQAIPFAQKGNMAEIELPTFAMYLLIRLDYE